MTESSVFESLLVVELAGVLAGPAVGMFFGELGSRVIKVENRETGGDVTRSWKGPAEHSGASAVRTVAFGGLDRTVDLAAPPGLSEHALEVMSELLGYTDERIDDLIGGGSVMVAEEGMAG